jgi:ArsR family metal-binding transcriptional regulator
MIHRRASSLRLLRRQEWQQPLPLFVSQFVSTHHADQYTRSAQVCIHALVNRTWERRAEITPDFSTRQRPTAMAVYKLLPGTNCRQCSQPSCWNFALKLVAAQVELAVCPPLGESAYAGRLADLEALLVPMPAIGMREEGGVSG